VSALDVPGGAFALAVTDDGAGGRRGTLAAGEMGVWMVDLSQPAEPRMIRVADTPGRARGVVVVDDVAYVADGDGGLLILRVTSEG
jgi:hypothetical protein